MKNMELLNSRGKKDIIKAIEDQFGCDTQFLKEYAIYKTPKGRLFIATIAAAEMELQLDIRKYSFGNYFGVIDETGGLRLSIEGSQLIGPHATKNVITLSDGKLAEWIAGADMPPKKEFSGYVIIKHNIDFVGCGKATETKLLNFVPKPRRISKLLTCETC